jgi:molybdenum cofactor cytidylyltransferase
MGHDKALLQWHGQTFLEAHLAALQSCTDFILIVAGGNWQSLQPIADAHAAFLAINPEPERGQFSSLQTGLQEVLNRGRDTAIVSLVDRPPVAASTMQQLRHVFENAPRDSWAVVPEYSGQHGHPIVLGREMITIILQAPPTESARAIEHANLHHIFYANVDDPLSVANIDTMEDYRKITS